MGEGMRFDTVKLMMKIAWRSWGMPYKWAGNDPMAGFDCSGYVIECLKSCGKLPINGDWTAAQLYGKFPVVPEGYVPKQGCLVFWAGQSGRIRHVEIVTEWVGFSIGAGGGGSKTITVADAIQQDAYIKVRPYTSRQGVFGFTDPFHRF